MAQEPRSQYHHFIPRFILKNFAHPFRPGKSRGKGISKKGLHRGQPMLYTINLTSNGEVVEVPIEKSFGLTDMYRDFRDAGNQHHLEQKLSILESQAGQIISRIRKRHEAGEPDVWMTRKERDLLRKFLFIMKYRGKGFHKRFMHETVQEYSANDKERMIQYMAERNFTRPIDVWFDNIRVLLELKMDPNANWAMELVGKMYKDDALWAYSLFQAFYLALCTPANPDDEFIVSENLFSLHEGPNSFSVDLESGNVTEGAYTEHHVFAVISPKLMMVLRSNFLPNPEEDANEEAKKERETLYNSMLNMHDDPSTAHSALEDLPVHKAKNSYSRSVGGRRVPIRGEDGKPRAYHKFGFLFFCIESDHVNKINCIILQEAHRITTLAFYSKAAMLKTLEWYLTLSTRYWGPGPNDFKVFSGETDARLVCLKNLERAARSMGSKVSAVYISRDLSPEPSDLMIRLDEELEKALEENSEGPLAPYLRLGGTAKTYFYDSEQAQKMLNMRIKIDIWSQGLDEDIRILGRKNLQNLFFQLEHRRVYLYVKLIRHMKLRDRRDNKGPGWIQHMEKLYSGPEDVIANVPQVFRRDRLGALLFFTASNSIEMAKNPDFSVDKEIPLDESGFWLFGLTQEIVFGDAGSICDCGIERVEAMAKKFTAAVQPTPKFDQFRNPLFSKEQSDEMLTRFAVKQVFKGIMDGKLPKQDLEALETVLFGTLYPTYRNRNE